MGSKAKRGGGATQWGGWEDEEGRGGGGIRQQGYRLSRLGKEYIHPAERSRLPHCRVQRRWSRRVLEVVLEGCSPERGRGGGGLASSSAVSLV